MVYYRSEAYGLPQHHSEASMTRAYIANAVVQTEVHQAARTVFSDIRMLRAANASINQAIVTSEAAMADARKAMEDADRLLLDNASHADRSGSAG